MSLLPKGVNAKRNFNLSFWVLIDNFNSNGLGNYTTEHSINDYSCKDSVFLTVYVMKDPLVSPKCESVDAGPDNSMTIEQTIVTILEGLDEVRRLYFSLLAKGVSKSGTFEPSNKIINAAFQNQPLGDCTTI